MVFKHVLNQRLQPNLQIMHHTGTWLWCVS